MKTATTKNLAIGATAAICLTFQLNAQDTIHDYLPSGRDTNAVYRHHMPTLGRFEKAKKVIGAELKNQQDVKLGKVKDLAVDLERGRIVEVIVATGGHLGVGEEIVAVPPELFMLDESNKVLRLDSTPEQLKTAPRFDLANWESSIDHNNVRAAYQHYGSDRDFHPDWDTTTASAKNEWRGASSTNAVLNSTNAFHHAGMGYIVRASELLGTPVKNLQDERVGKLEELVLDLPAGRVAEAIVASGGFLGMGDEYSVLPPAALSFDPDHKSLRLDTTRERLTSAPHFRGNAWPDVYQSNYVAGVYQNYRVEPYYSTNGVDNSARNMRDRNGVTLTPFDQGTSPEDRNLTVQIRKQILAIDQLSVNARNVKIITVNGKVTLRGPVNSDDEKSRLDQIAKQFASPGNVDNQLEVVTPRRTGSLE